MSPEQVVRFPVGAKVRHKRTGFTFVVVEHDPKYLGERKASFTAARRYMGEGKRLCKMKYFPDANLELQ